MWSFQFWVRCRYQNDSLNGNVICSWFFNVIGELIPVQVFCYLCLNRLYSHTCTAMACIRYTFIDCMWTVESDQGLMADVQKHILVSENELIRSVAAGVSVSCDSTDCVVWSGQSQQYSPKIFIVTVISSAIVCSSCYFCVIQWNPYLISLLQNGFLYTESRVPLNGGWSKLRQKTVHLPTWLCIIIVK
jgi:hypothetical protein